MCFTVGFCVWVLLFRFLNCMILRAGLLGVSVCCLVGCGFWGGDCCSPDLGCGL